MGVQSDLESSYSAGDIYSKDSSQSIRVNSMGYCQISIFCWG